MNNQVGLYARVSSERQKQNRTIESQVEVLKKQIKKDGHTLLKDYEFLDDGYSGSNLVRPGLEQLRDDAASGKIGCVYILSPDRLARKYAHQMLLLEEFQASDIDVRFLNHDFDTNPESQLFLQMQGMIAEYERAKIIERNRRGKIYAAKRGSVSALVRAPYGYRYITKSLGNGEASFEIIEEEAEIVRKIFNWVGRERISISAVCSRLKDAGYYTQSGKLSWNRSSIHGMLKNTVYKGMAAFGKTKKGNKLTSIRPHKNSSEYPKNAYSIYPVEKDKWIYIPVPALVSENLFEAVQLQLEENRKIARSYKRGATYLLQGLVVCKHCQYAYYGKYTEKKRGEKINRYTYYRCIGTDTKRFVGRRMCQNKQIRCDLLETAVWTEVKQLLKNPERLFDEHKRRLAILEKKPSAQESQVIAKQQKQLERGIARLIDSYAGGYISKEEFEPRIKVMKNKVISLKEEQEKITNQSDIIDELRLVSTNLENFAKEISASLENITWEKKRAIIRTLVKRIEIAQDEVNIVFRVNALSCKDNAQRKSLQHCPWSCNNAITLFAT